VNFSRFRAATRISRVNCTKMAGDRPRQPAYGIFSTECRFWQFKFGPFRFKEACTCGCQIGVPFLKSGYLSTAGLSNVRMVADRHRHAA